MPGLDTINLVGLEVGAWPDFEEYQGQLKRVRHMTIEECAIETEALDSILGLIPGPRSLSLTWSDLYIGVGVCQISVDKSACSLAKQNPQLERLVLDTRTATGMLARDTCFGSTFPLRSLPLKHLSITAMNIAGPEISDSEPEISDSGPEFWFTQQLPTTLP